jgi:hypothetical protein
LQISRLQFSAYELLEKLLSKLFHTKQFNAKKERAGGIWVSWFWRAWWREQPASLSPTWDIWTNFEKVELSYIYEQIVFKPVDPTWNWVILQGYLLSISGDYRKK